MSPLEHIAHVKPKILVVGDIMLDHYRIANATRISPEAPVPVLLNPREEFRLGGAAAVAAMCAALGAEVALIGIVGEDMSGQCVLELLSDAGVAFGGIVTRERVTTTKERICGVASGRHRQQLGRIDTEDERPLPLKTEQELCEIIQSIAADPPDALLVADYAKGVVTLDIAAASTNTCRVTIADPPRDGNWGKYRRFSCIVPNREEARGQSARQIRTTLQTEAAIVKLDQEGCEVDMAHSANRSIKIAARQRSIHDVTGAGDQFLAVLGWVLSRRGSWLDAAELANVAAGMQVERHGCVPVTVEELLREVCDDTSATIIGNGTLEATRLRLATAG